MPLVSGSSEAETAKTDAMQGPSSRKLSNAIETSSSLVGVVCLAGLLVSLVPSLRLLGIVPRTLSGLVGIAFSPLLHANLAHLLANAAPLFVLLTLLFMDRHYRPGIALVCIWIVSGFGTWLIGRGGTVHLGASSIIYGLVTYLAAAGFLLRSWQSAFVALLVVLLYGGVMYGVLPQHGPVSWEGHLCGACAGLWVAWKNRR